MRTGIRHVVLPTAPTDFVNGLIGLPEPPRSPRRGQWCALIHQQPDLQQPDLLQCLAELRSRGAGRNRVADIVYAFDVGARLKCHRVCKVEMTPGRRGGLTRPHLSPKFCAMDAPLSAYLAPPDCLAAAGVVDRPADGSADMKLAARARMPAPR